MAADEINAETLERARAGNAEAWRAIDDQMRPRLRGLARQRLRTPLADGSASDIANSVLRTFHANLAAGGYPDLHDETSLWRMLAHLTRIKIADAYRRATTQKRGGDRHQLLADEEQLAQWADGVIDPAHEVELRDLLECLLSLLPAHLTRIAEARLQDGLSNAEIAEALGVSCSTIEEAFRSIRKRWRDYGTSQGWTDDLFD